MSDDNDGGHLERHVDLTAVRRFGAGELPKIEAFDVAWHLFLCPDCRRHLAAAGLEAQAAYRRLFGDGGMKFPVAAYSHPVGQVAETLREIGIELQADRAGARQLVSRLLRHAPERRRMLARDRERYRTYSVADALIDASREQGPEDPAAGEEIAELALWVLDHLGRPYPEDMLNDLRARAWAAIGDCRRIGANLASVAQAFDLAESYLERGTGDPVDAATFFDLRVAYLIDLHRFPEADAGLQHLLSAYRDAGDRHAEGRVLRQLAALRREEGMMDEAIVLLERARGSLDFTREPELDLPTRRDLALYCAESGRPERAQAMLPEIRDLVRKRDGRAERLRLLRVEGVVYRGLGHLELAIEALEQARIGFLDMGLAWDAAFTTLDLTLAYADAEVPERAFALAAEMHTLFESREIHRDLGREARAALGMVRRALELQAMDRRLVGEVAAFLRRAEGGGPIDSAS